MKYDLKLQEFWNESLYIKVEFFDALFPNEENVVNDWPDLFLQLFLKIHCCFLRRTSEKQGKSCSKIID